MRMTRHNVAVSGTSSQHHRFQWFQYRSPCPTYFLTASIVMTIVAHVNSLFIDDSSMSNPSSHDQRPPYQVFDRSNGLTAAMPSSYIKLLLRLKNHKDQTSGHGIVNKQDFWMYYTRRFAKNYVDRLEHNRRRVIWETKINFAEYHNREYHKGRRSFVVSDNQYSDWLPEEYSNLLGSTLRTSPLDGSTIGTSRDVINWAKITSADINNLPSYINWTMEGWVTPVVDQGNCGSCWAFAASGSLEGQLFNKSGTLDPVSVQNIIDCGTPNGYNACRGGLIDWAYGYAVTNGAINLETSYPYIGKQGIDCFYDSVLSLPLGNLQTWITLPVGNEVAMMLAVAKIGPLSAAVDASPLSFQMYSGGIYSIPDCSTNINHGVLIVGYGTTPTTQQRYWIIKNSWSTTWGDNGYMLLDRDKNMCGIAMCVSYPVLL